VKKLLLILGAALSTYILGDIIFIATKNGLIANWGQIIIPSVISGIIINAYFKEDKLLMLKVIPATVATIKILQIFISADNLTFMAIVLMVLLYPSVSYIFVKLGYTFNLKSKG
jgi:hypothetical protein